MHCYCSFAVPDISWIGILRSDTPRIVTAAAKEYYLMNDKNSQWNCSIDHILFPFSQIIEKLAFFWFITSSGNLQERLHGLMW